MGELRPASHRDVLTRNVPTGARDPSWQAGGSVKHSSIGCGRAGAVPPPRDNARLRRYMPNLYRELYGDDE